MKIKKKAFPRILLIIAFIFGCGNQIFGQEKVNISGGYGFPELYNIEIQYQLKQAQIGLSVGALPAVYNRGEISISGDVYLHFAGFSELSDRRPVYYRCGIILLFEERRFINDFSGLNMRIGRDMNISRRVGIGIDTGFWFFSVFKPESLGIGPSLGIKFFIRI